MNFLKNTCFAREKQVILSCAQNPCDIPFSTGWQNPINKTANWGWHQCSHGIQKINPTPLVTTAPLHLLNPPELVALASPATQGILQRHSTTYHKERNHIIFFVLRSSSVQTFLECYLKPSAKVSPNYDYDNSLTLSFCPK